eukprot:TRINITY_DN12318_c0_g1_i6.p1 TRINITY_DN12318_c0_g1~~TRINITY_DN12318_c0_g1_i6.p1  ORF type:complete len:494 (-),score=96.94 TRINITY_DN12318_c0_g1_i6:415-1896(-)
MAYIAKEVMGSRRGTSSRKSVVPGIIRTKADAPMKTSRQRRRTGGASSKSTSDAKISCAKAKKSAMETTIPIKRTTASGLSPPCHETEKGFSKTPTLESGQTSPPLVKLKLQLFPVDEVTCIGLEKDGHNPHLELTLGARKKISSVLKHLNIKWGNSSIASGELMLFPYNIQQGNLASCRRWTLKDTDISAADVYATMGCPPIFRLRYGWFSSPEPMTSQAPHLTSPHYEDCLKLEDAQKGCINMKDIEVEKKQCQEDMPVFVNAPSNATIARTIPLDQAVDAGNLRMGSDTTIFPALWADTATNISMGDLLKETSRKTEANHSDPLPVNKGSCLSQIPFNSDSFDAAIAAHISRHQGTGLSTPAFHTSIWDAEETCHAFPFQKIENSRNEVVMPSQNTASGPSSQITDLNSMRSPDSDHACQEHPPDSLPHKHDPDDTESNFRMTDITWSDSLGPLDLGLSSSRQIISGDSISLSGLLASSLDAFQNCSFFR